MRILQPMPQTPHTMLVVWGHVCLFIYLFSLYIYLFLCVCVFVCLFVSLYMCLYMCLSIHTAHLSICVPISHHHHHIYIYTKSRIGRLSYSLIHVFLFHPSIHPCMHACIHSSMPSLLRSEVRSVIHSFIHSCVPTFQRHTCRHIVCTQTLTERHTHMCVCLYT